MIEFNAAMKMNELDLQGFALRRCPCKGACWMSPFWSKYKLFLHICSCIHTKSLQSCLTLCDPMDYSLQAPLSMGFCRQEYWSGLPRPPPGDLPNPGIKPTSLASLAFQADSLPTEPPGKPKEGRPVFN